MDNGGWIDVRDALPDSEQRVLAVKQLKDGRRDICIAYCNLCWPHYNVKTREMEIGPYWVCGGNNNVIYWQPLPEMPEDGKELGT